MKDSAAADYLIRLLANLANAVLPFLGNEKLRPILRPTPNTDKNFHKNKSSCYRQTWEFYIIYWFLFIDKGLARSDLAEVS